MSIPKHTVRFTESALAAELERLQGEEPKSNGLTLIEICEAVRIGNNKARHLVKKGIESGAIEVTEGRRRSPLTGLLHRTYFYRAARKKGRKKKG